MTIHNAIIVSSACGVDKLRSVHLEAIQIFSQVSMIIPHADNTGGSFLIPPDATDEGEGRRRQFIAWLKTERPPLQWVKVQYGET